MKFGVYSIQDVKTGFMAPAVEINDQVAMRNFQHAIMQSDSILFTHASDFKLYKIGEFDSDNAMLDQIVPVVLIADGGAVLK